MNLRFYLIRSLRYGHQIALVESKESEEWAYGESANGIFGMAFQEYFTDINPDQFWRE